MYNHIAIMGRFVRDPELQRTASGVAVARFTLACDRDFKNKETGSRDTDFVDCTAWRNTGEFASNHFGKGRMALVEGRLQIDNWTDKEGTKRRNAVVVVSNIYFADSKPKEDSAAGSTPSPNSVSSGGAVGDFSSSSSYGFGGSFGNGFADVSDDDGDLPF